MDKVEAVLRELVTQVARVAFVLEEIAKNKYHVIGQQQPCRCCGSTLTIPYFPFTKCPVCMTENAR